MTICFQFALPWNTTKTDMLVEIHGSTFKIIFCVPYMAIFLWFALFYLFVQILDHASLKLRHFRPESSLLFDLIILRDDRLLVVIHLRKKMCILLVTSYSARECWGSDVLIQMMRRKRFRTSREIEFWRGIWCIQNKLNKWVGRNVWLI